MIKYAANASIATKITFINEFAARFERVGVDNKKVSRGMRLDKRIRGKFVQARPGFVARVSRKTSESRFGSDRNMGLRCRSSGK